LPSKHNRNELNNKIIPPSLFNVHECLRNLHIWDGGFFKFMGEIITTNPESESKMYNPMKQFYELCRSIDYQRPNGSFANYDKRGELITLYLELTELHFYINTIAPTNNELRSLREKYFEMGYPKEDYYFRIGHYVFRLLDNYKITK
jgi:hypothetical protein